MMLLPEGSSNRCRPSLAALVANIPDFGPLLDCFFVSYFIYLLHFILFFSFALNHI